MTRRSLPLAAALAAAAALAPSVAAQAAELAVGIEIPRLSVAEYHRPYVAAWLERDGAVMANLAVWYDEGMADDEGKKWLVDLRQWWRRSGRSTELPLDGVSGATRPVGRHRLAFTVGEAPLGDLPAGDYRLVVEAAREVGGREVIALPFAWPVAAPATHEARGEHELGLVSLELTP